MLKQLGLSKVFLFFTLLCYGQTTFSPGDIMVMGVSTNACGLPPESDEISFVCLRDFTGGTTLHITDNGWEVSNANQWGDGEGTLSITRPLGNIAAGTVITLQCVNDPGGWTYRIVSPDPFWTINNVGGGPLNLEDGGDQLYFLSGGNWNNPPGANNATYSGHPVAAFNTRSTWGANGTTQQSNIHPDLTDCAINSAPNTDHYLYTGDFSPGDQFAWPLRNIDGSNWSAFADCMDYDHAMPDYSHGFSIAFNHTNIGVACFRCSGCKPHNDFLTFSLPGTGKYNVVYTNGTDTFTLEEIINGWLVLVEEYDDITYSIISVEQVGGCIYNGPFDGEAEYTIPNHNPGTHGEVWTCPDYGNIYLLNYLGGMPEMGGTWAPPIQLNQYYNTGYGEGRWYYVFKYDPPPMPPCTPDTASVDVHFIDPSASTIEVTCDQNGTPNNIFDDRTVFTFTLNGEHVDDGSNMYYVTVDQGTITPTMGLAFEPTTFTLSPGTALSGSVTFTVHLMNSFFCDFDFEIPAPGYCSDPCDPNMTAQIDGGGDICLNSCPDEPQYITVETSGGTSPYNMYLSLSAPGFPSWVIGDIEISDYHEIEVCVGNVGAPIYNEGTAQLTIPAALGDNDLLITLTDVFDFYNCPAILDETEAIITVHDLPFVDTLTLEFCSRFANNVDLTNYDLDINPFLDVTWFDENPFLGGQQLFNPNQVNLFNVVELWAQVEDDYCFNAIKVPFTIIPSPDLDSIPPIEICEGGSVLISSIVISDDSDSTAVYTFHTGFPLDTSTLIDTNILTPADSTKIYLLANFKGCYDTLEIQINIQAYPTFTILDVPCNLQNDTYSVILSTTAGTIISSAGTVINHPAGNDTIRGIPENVNVTIELLNASSLCRDTIEITAPNCNCPSINQPVPAQASYVICDGDAIPLMSVNVDPTLIANWYNVPSGGVALLQNSLTFQPPSSVSANYYVEALDPSNGCTSLRTQIPFTVHPVADLQPLANPVLCQDETINFATLAPGVLNGVNGTGSWFRLSNNQPVSGSVAPANNDSFYYLFSSNPGGCLSSDTIVAIVNPNPSIDIFNILCVDATLTYEISFTTDADNVIANVGNLTQVGTTDTFHITNIPFDTDIIINLENSVTGCTSQINQAAPDCSCPDLLQETDITVCSDDANIDLEVYEGFGVEGTWQMVSTPPGGNPATLTGDNFNGTNADAGTYTLRFIRSIILDDCVDTSAFTIQLRTSVQVDAGVDGTSCAPDDIVLTGTASGTGVQFTWTENGSGNITNPNSLNTTYTPTQNDIVSGSVSFTLTGTDPTGACPSDAETIDITIDDSAYYILNAPAQVYCDTADVLIDLDDLITFGVTSGEWFFPDTVGAPVTGGSQINPSTLEPGTYTIFYASTTAVPPCKNDTTAVTLIIENCLCPSVAITAPAGAICEGESLDLDPLVITSEPGDWTVMIAPVGSNPMIAGSSFVTNQEGTYTLRYTIDNIVVGCPDFSEIQVVVTAIPSLTVTSSGCAGDLLSWQAVITSDADQVTVNAGNLTNTGGNQYTIDNIPLGTQLDITASNAGGLCESTITIPTPDCDCDLAVSGLPQNAELCPGENITLDAAVTGAQGNITAGWVRPDGSPATDPVVASQTGTYTYTVRDELGCEVIQSVEVNVLSTMTPDITSTDITCPGDRDGAIIIDAVNGGTAPYMVSVNGGPSSVINAFPYTISNLGGGNYTLEITDASNCKITETVPVQSASSETVSLGPDQTILVGDSAQISAVLSFTPDTFYWEGDLSLINPDALSSWIHPEQDVTFTFFALDENNCLYSDDVLVRVLLTSSLYVPNVFSPNGDGINDLLAPVSDPSITEIISFQIYSRWGETVYEKKGFAPDATIGWDGSFNGKEMNPGVYVYRISAINKRGKEIMEYGSITLVK